MNVSITPTQPKVTIEPQNADIKVGTPTARYVIDPYITAEETEDGVMFTVTAQGVTTTGTAYNGQDGADGQDGANGQNGQDGVSPAVTVSNIAGGHRVNITDADHPGGQNFDVMDGVNGTNGTNGTNGYSPTATVSKSGKTTTISITDKNGTTTATVNDGATDYNDLENKPSINGETLVGDVTVNDTKVYQQYQASSGYTYWRPLLVGKSSNSSEGFTPSSTTDQTYAFNTLEVQPSTGTIRMGAASMFKGSYTSKISPTTLTANRTVTIPNKSGTIAFTDDILPLVNDGTSYPITAITKTLVSGVSGVLLDYDDGNSGQLFFADGVGLATVKSAIESGIPHDTSELTNGAGYLTISDLPIYGGGVQ